MPTFQKCPKAVVDLARDVMCEHETNQPLLDAHVTIDFVFAFADQDDDGKLLNDALKLHGVRALAIARKIPLKDRAMGRADAEICIDGDWWKEALEKEQRALLDHEIHHLMVKIDKRGLVRDDLGRPVIQLRKHDYQFGWFKIIAERNGGASLEVQQAKIMWDAAKQAFWPDIVLLTR